MSAGPSSSGKDEVDVKELAGNKDKIKALMRRDPRFITRLIGQLDAQMHKMMHEKHERQKQAKADAARMEQIDATIASHITPQLTALEAGLKEKRETRQRVQEQLEKQMGDFKAMEREAAALMSKVRCAAGKLNGKVASDRLQECKGFSSRTPTTALIKGKKAPS